MGIALKSTFDHLLFSTTRITVQTADGKDGVGTGFFMQFGADQLNSNLVFPVLVTNRHVVEHAATGQILLHRSRIDDSGQEHPSGVLFGADLEQFSRAWIGHPDESVDLAGIPIAYMLNHLIASDSKPFILSIPEEMIPTDPDLEDMSVLGEVVMVGYPHGLWDEVTGFPIYRRGTTATHPATGWQGRRTGLLDIAAFPGSSGSPIVTMPTGLRQEPNYGSNDDMARAPKLLGVLSKYLAPETSGEIRVVDVPTQDVPVPFTRTPLHLGMYEQAHELLPLRDAMIAQLREREGRQPPTVPRDTIPSDAAALPRPTRQQRRAEERQMRKRRLRG